MFDVEIKNLKVFANLGITAEERKKKQLLKVTTVSYTHLTLTTNREE